MKKQYWIIIPLVLFIMSCGKRSELSVKNEGFISVPDTITTQKGKIDIDWNGKYLNNDGDLTITNYKSEIGFDFAISIVTKPQPDEACIGDVKGKAKMINSKTARSDEGETCQLEFTFDGKNRIIIKEVDCPDNHGALCTFDGAFKK